MKGPAYDNVVKPISDRFDRLERGIIKLVERQPSIDISELKDELQKIREDFTASKEGGLMPSHKETPSQTDANPPEKAEPPAQIPQVQPPTPPQTEEHTHEHKKEPEEPINLVEHLLGCPDCFKDLQKNIGPLLKCKGCNKIVSETFEKCPNCGSKEGRPIR